MSRASQRRKGPSVGSASHHISRSLPRRRSRSLPRRRSTGTVTMDPNHPYHPGTLALRRSRETCALSMVVVCSSLSPSLSPLSSRPTPRIALRHTPFARVLLHGPRGLRRPLRALFGAPYFPPALVSPLFVRIVLLSARVFACAGVFPHHMADLDGPPLPLAI